MERGVKAGRRLCVIGRSMERNIEVARKLGYVDIEERHFIESHEINRFADKDLLIVTTGSQGEEMADSPEWLPMSIDTLSSNRPIRSSSQPCHPRE